MTKERYQELKEMLKITPEWLDEGDGVRVAQLYDLVIELIQEFELSQPSLSE